MPQSRIQEYKNHTKIIEINLEALTTFWREKSQMRLCHLWSTTVPISTFQTNQARLRLYEMSW